MSNIVFVQSPVSYNLFISPESDSAAALQIYPTSPATHFDKVDDPATMPNDDTDYVFGNAMPPSLLDMYNLMNHTSETGTINYVQVFTRAKSYPVSQAASGEYKHKIICGTGTALSSNYAPLTTSYQLLGTSWTKRPADNLAWTWADIDALLAGVLCSSPTVGAGTINVIIRPTGTGDYSENIPYGDTPNWKCVDEENPDGVITTVSPPGDGNSEVWAKDLYTLTQVTPGLAIHSVTVYALVRASVTYGRGHVQFGIKENAVTTWSGTQNFQYVTWYVLSYAWSVKPSSGTAWTWTDINNLQAGVNLSTDTDYGVPSHSLCTQVYVVVNCDAPVNPEIRTTQLYVMVNYTPSPASVTLLAPNEVRYANARRTERFIFPDGTYCIGDYGRAGKQITLIGTETTNAIQKMRQVQAMLQNPSPVTISGLLDVNQDILWRLKSFDFEYDIGGDHYDWKAELASYDYVEGSP